jgi:hypothetical protein
MKNLNTIKENIKNDSDFKKAFKNQNIWTLDEYIDVYIQNAKRYIKAVKNRSLICTIPHVSSSGMTRCINFYQPTKNSVLNFHSLFEMLGYRYNDNKNGFIVSGCGMDMVFHTNYSNIHHLHRLGFMSKKECSILAQNTPTYIN